MKIWISGPMSGLPDLNGEEFSKEAKRLRDLGHHVVNPAEFHWINEGSYPDVLLRVLNIIAYFDIEHVVALRDWQDSPGASTEIAFAEAIGIDISYQTW